MTPKSNPGPDRMGQFFLQRALRDMSRNVLTLDLISYCGLFERALIIPARDGASACWPVRRMGARRPCADSSEGLLEASWLEEEPLSDSKWVSSIIAGLTAHWGEGQVPACPSADQQSSGMAGSDAPVTDGAKPRPGPRLEMNCVPGVSDGVSR